MNTQTDRSAVIIAPTASPAVSSQLIETALRAAAGATGMQLVFVSVHRRADVHLASPSRQARRHLRGREPAAERDLLLSLAGGRSGLDRRCGTRPGLLRCALAHALAITSYVGVPLRQGGVITGTLGGFDAGVTPVAPSDLLVLPALARMIMAEAARDPEVRLRRTATGWEVEDPIGAVSHTEDLTVAMSLADLIAAEVADPVPPQRPPRPGDDLSESERLRVQISQLEHALSARVVIEQAIGVLSQRFR